MKNWIDGKRIRHGVAIVICCIVGMTLYAQETQKLMLSGDGGENSVLWDFYCTAGRNSGTWTKIKVPSCWELEGFGEYNYGHDQNKAAEKGIYRTTFEVPKTWKGQRVFLVFDGSMTDTKVTVNGKSAGDVHQGSFYRFKREITDLISSSTLNKLEVEVSKMSSNASVNSAERDADFWVFGGIFRPVYLEAVPETHMEYSGIDAKADGKIDVEVFLDSEIKHAKVKAEIFELISGKKVGDFSSDPINNAKKIRLQSVIPNVRAWSTESPILYKAVITLVQNDKDLHTITERFGFRTVEVRERDGIYVNNKKIRFKGVNRHCFWPTTGRTVSREQSLADVLLIKEMNMNAVRMSHYPPDKHFLELCDSLGLYVINELCAWQSPPYDTKVGTILVNEMVKRDINHPSIVFWANGNEGGFNFDLDTLFSHLDIQKRSVLHPFGLFGNVNTVHYITYNSGIKDMFNGRDIFMPTELIHGLYDGGHGAGLDDYWNLMLSNPLSAGMFLWDFADQGVVRTDKNGILDTDRDHGADGIVGPYREKEGSFFTIKEVWSPIFLEKKFITSAWNGEFRIENRYDFTNTNQCTFSYALSRINSIEGDVDTIKGKIDAPDIEPGNHGLLKLKLPQNWRTFDILYVTAKDPNGSELFTWSYEISSPASFADRILKNMASDPNGVEFSEDDSLYMFKASGISAKISKATGLLIEVRTEGGEIPLNGGPIFITDQDLECKSVKLLETDGSFRVDVSYDYKKGGKAYQFSWKMNGNGILQLDYDYRPRDGMEMAGITFDFPEVDIEGASLIANGPYRVYNNRMKGGSLGVWEKEYNDAITGEVWEYPEFKGYYSLFYGMKLRCATPFEVYSTSEDVTLHLFTPKIQPLYDKNKNYTVPNYPLGNISFMDAIPSVGTKFGRAEELGPQSQRHRFKSFSGSPNMKNRLFFKFN